MKTYIFELEFNKFLTLKSEPITDEKDLKIKRQVKSYFNNLLGRLVGVIITEKEI